MQKHQQRLQQRLLRASLRSLLSPLDLLVRPALQSLLPRLACLPPSSRALPLPPRFCARRLSVRRRRRAQQLHRSPRPPLPSRKLRLRAQRPSLLCLLESPSQVERVQLPKLQRLLLLLLLTLLLLPRHLRLPRTMSQSPLLHPLLSPLRLSPLSQPLSPSLRLRRQMRQRLRLLLRSQRLLRQRSLLTRLRLRMSLQPRSLLHQRS